MQRKWGAPLWLGLVWFAAAQSHVRAVHISTVRPAAEFQPAAGGPWQPAVAGQAVVEGMKLRTAAADRAEVQLECGSALRLDFNTQADFSTLATTEKGVHLTTVRLLDGNLEATLFDADQKGFEVDFGTGSLTTAANASIRLDLASPDHGIEVEVFGGKANVKYGAARLDLGKDETISFDASGHATKGHVELPGDAFSAWTRQRDQVYRAALSKYRFSQAASAGTPGSANSGSGLSESTDPTSATLGANNGQLSQRAADAMNGGGGFGSRDLNRPADGNGDATVVVPPHCGN